MDNSIQVHSNLSRIGILQQIGGGVPVTLPIKDRPTDLRPINVIEREPIVRKHAGLQQPVSHGRLPLQHRRLEHHFPLHPLIRLVHQPLVPAGAAQVGRAGASVEAGIQAGAAAQDPSAGVDDAVGGDEGLEGEEGELSARVAAKVAMLLMVGWP